MRRSSPCHKDVHASTRSPNPSPDQVTKRQKPVKRRDLGPVRRTAGLVRRRSCYSITIVHYPPATWHLSRLVNSRYSDSMTKILIVVRGSLGAMSEIEDPDADETLGTRPRSRALYGIDTAYAVMLVHVTQLV